MQVILLAAGQSTRLAPISDKNTLEFSGLSLVEHRIKAIKRANLRDIVVVGSAKNMNSLRDLLKAYKNVAVVEQTALKDGMAGGVLAGAKKVTHKQIMIVSTNDVVEPALFEQAMQASKTAEDGIIVGKKVENYFPGGYLTLDKNKYITGIIEKPGEGKEPGTLVNIVLHVFNNFPAFQKRLEAAKTKKDDRYEVALDQYIKKDKAKIQALKYLGFWQPVKYPWHILRVMEYFLQNQEPRIDRNAEVSKNAIISGNVYIGAGTRVLANATIVGPAYIGDNCVIATNSLVRDSMIGNNSVVGFASEVTRSFVNHNVWAHSTYIGDSIVDHNVSFGSGTVLGNLRFDEEEVHVNVQNKRIPSGSNKFGAIIGDGVRFGINSCTNPGIRVGSNTFIGGGVLVDRDIPDNKIVILRQQLKIVTNKKSADTDSRPRPTKK
jgi:bifunctional UDP-N-acetylglucosamine pyrophosphorylase/glucosamine-1-phosphate N-acetyltransferase